MQLQLYAKKSGKYIDTLHRYINLFNIAGIVFKIHENLHPLK